MKRLYIFFIASVVLFTACNGDEKVEKPAAAPVIETPAMPAQEKKLRDDVNAHPDSMKLRMSLITYFTDNSDYSSALKELNLAIAKDSTDDQMWDMKANLHYESGDTTSAIKAFEKAIEIYPDPQYVMTLGSVYAQVKDKRALEIADALLVGKKANADKEALFIKGLYYNYTGDKLKAISFFDKCISLSYTFMFAYREKAIALYDLGKYEDALAVLDRALTIQNQYDEAYYYSGLCLEKLNRKEEAIVSYQNALRISPEYVEAKNALARLGVSSN